MSLYVIISFILGTIAGFLLSGLFTSSSNESRKEELYDKMVSILNGQCDIITKNLDKARKEGTEDITIEKLFEGTVFKIKDK